MSQLLTLRAATLAALSAPRSPPALAALRAALAAEDDGTVSEEVWDAVGLVADGVGLVQIGLERLRVIRDKAGGGG